MEKVHKYFIVLIISTVHFFSFSQESQKILDSLSHSYNHIETLGEAHFFSILNPLLKNPKNRRENLNALYFQGQYYTLRGMSDSAIYAGNKIIKIASSKSDALTDGMLIRAYHTLGIANIKKGLYDQSKYWHQKGIELSEKIDDQWFLIMHTYGLARSYNKLKNNEKALELFQQTIESDINAEIVYGSHISIGNIYGEQFKYKLSNEHYEKAVEMCEEAGNNICIVTTLINLGQNHYKEKNYNSALEYYNNASDIISQHKFTHLNPDASILAGAVYMDLKQYDNASIIFSTGLYYAIEYNYMDRQVEFYDRLKDIAIIKKDFKTALNHERNRYDIMNSIHEQQKEKEINELEVKFSTLQKEKEIELLTKDQLLKDSELIREKSFKKIMLIAFFIILIPIIALLFVYYQKLITQSQLAKKQKEVNEQKITALIKGQELELIKASVEGQDNERKRIAQELHDSIGGNLAAIKLQFGSIPNSKEVYKTISKQIDDTYNQVRIISHDLLPKKFSQNPFLSVITEYMENIGNASDLKITCNGFPKDKINAIDKYVQIETFKILQELITNTIKHAKASIVEIQLNLVNDSINILFEDNGVGFNSNIKSGGIGISNIKSRLKNIDGTINIDSRIKRGTIINIEIPTNVLSDEI